MNANVTAEVLFANDCFYAAFANGDFDAMTALWAELGTVCCLHPGWEPLLERDHILASWAAILHAPPSIRCESPSVLPVGPDGAAVVCWEEINGEYLIATNVFWRENGVWRLVHHQAGPVRGTPPKDDPADDAGRRVN